jgi:hypothetical protein
VVVSRVVRLVVGGGSIAPRGGRGLACDGWEGHITSVSQHSTQGVARRLLVWPLCVRLRLLLLLLLLAPAAAGGWQRPSLHPG